MKTMNFMLILLLVLMGCAKKDDITTKDHYLKATINGKKINFKMASYQLGGDNGSIEFVTIGGTESSTPADGALANGFTFEISRAGGSLTAGTYDVRAEEDMYAVYYIQSQNGTIEYDATWANDAFIVKIDVISKTNIKGSFSGVLRNELGQTISITEGTFHLPNEVIVNT
ncbi:MAG: hypothetical protein EOP48_25935 [Sphingobacteriales bacterium]|nr:MAG: hypothetical protein EOP48_25935 [Sphingobacteriales bacterium]